MKSFYSANLILGVRFLTFLILLAAAQVALTQKTQYSGNPVFPGWYADPEVAVFGDTFWIYPTTSQAERTIPEAELSEEQRQIRANTINQQYLEQSYLDAFSSTDLVNWQKHEDILTIKDIRWASYAVWAPATIEHKGKYYLFFAANDIQNDEQPGGIGIAVADTPSGPFKDYLGKPLIDAFHNGAQPIDQFIFKDDDNTLYMFYGGWRHCNVVRLNDDLDGLEAYEDGTIFKEITPEGYVEGPFMFKRENKYYFMWSEGGWGLPDYSVAYAIADSPLGPFKRIGKILQQDPAVATGAGHHSVLKIPDRDDYYIVYHRRPLNTNLAAHRHVCIDRMEFDSEGYIKPVRITNKGVRGRPR